MPRKAAEAEAKDAEPKAPKPRSGSAAARLAAEVERLSAELAASRLRIGELENRVDVDPLTQTFNRRGFERALARSLAYVKRYRATAALVYLDLDEFKPVNDRHGHAAGNAVLKAISGALLREMRASVPPPALPSSVRSILPGTCSRAPMLPTRRRYAGALPPWYRRRRVRRALVEHDGGRRAQQSRGSGKAS
jgi:Diguanylate cyclase, GGDEF domain